MNGTLHRTLAATVQADIGLLVLLDFGDFQSGIFFVTTAGQACNNIVITSKDLIPLKGLVKVWTILQVQHIQIFKWEQRTRSHNKRHIRWMEHRGAESGIEHLNMVLITDLT